MPPQAPNSQRRRLTALHYQSEESLLHGAEKVLISRQENEDGDYHQDMSFEFYKTRLTKLAGNLETVFGRDKVVLVIDNAPCHFKRLHRIPTSVDTKDKLARFLQQHALPYEALWMKKIMLQAIQKCIAGKKVPDICGGQDCAGKGD